jgi:hypothetical protein
LVSTSEFIDVKAYLQTILSTRKKSDKKEGPTLRKRESADRTETETQTPTVGTEKDEDKPPVLRRRD